MSLDTLSSRAPSLPMPMIQNSTGWPSGPQGWPWRLSSSARAWRQAWSSAISASSVVAWVMVASGAWAQQSSSMRRAMTSWRRMRSAAGRGWPRSCSAANVCSMLARTGAPGGSRDHSSA
jgi:hypothetical protein